MKNIVVVLLLFVSISLGAKPKKIFIDGYGIRGDEVTVWLKNGSTKTIKKEEFDKGMYVFEEPIIGGTIVSGTSEAPCLGGVIFLTDSKYDADYVIRETTRNNYDCTIRIVDESSPDCDEWRITPYSSTADRKVYIVPKNELGYDYKVRIIR